MGTPSRQAAPVAAARDVIVVLSTAPDAATAERIARSLVQARLAACVNIVPGLVSVYRWKGSVSRDAEVLCVIKTRRALFARLASRIREEHPYEVPEILALEVTGSAKAYLDWLRSETAPAPRRKAPVRRARPLSRQKGTKP